MRILSAIVVANLRSNLKVLDRAIKEQLNKYGVGEYVNKNTDFTVMLLNLANKYCRQFDDDTKYDMLLGAFKYVFLEAISRETKGAISNFDGTINGNFVAIEQYIYTLLSNALKNELKRGGTQDALKNQEIINQLEGETYDQAVDRIMYSPKIKSIKRAGDREYLEYLRGVLKEYEESLARVDKAEVTVPSRARTIKKLEKVIEALRTEITEIENEATENAKFLEMEERIDDFSAEEEVLYQNLLAQIDKKAKRLYKDRDYQRVKATLVLLIDGYSKSEIARELDLSNGMVTNIIKLINEAIRALAVEQSKSGDPTLLNGLNSYGSATLDTINKSKASLNTTDASLYIIFQELEA